jgi:hypothetical protein
VLALSREPHDRVQDPECLPGRRPARAGARARESLDVGRDDATNDTGIEENGIG